jgi:phage integrase family site-specific recombinase
MARSVKQLNNKSVDNAKPKDKPYTLTDGNGLFLLVMPSGSKTWQFNYYRPITKKRAKFSLGAYPSVTIAQARSIREEYRSLLAQDIDPQSHLKEQQEEQSATFLSVANRWKEKRQKEVEPLTMKKNWDRLEKYLFPIIGHYSVDKITSPLLIDTFKPLNDKGYNDTLHRMFNLSNQILNYAVTIGLIPVNVCQKAADAYHKEAQTHHPAIKPQQLPKLLFDFKNSNRSFLTKVLFRWQLLSMVRPAEAVSVEWSEIDFTKKLWTIPAIKMKKTKQGQFPHIVPLSSQMLAILEELKPITGEKKFVFPHHHLPNKSMSKEIIANSLRKIGYKDIQDSHGLRSIARTYLEEKAVDFRLSESCLAHKIGDSTSQAYNRYDYIELRRPVMQLWGDYVEQCER